MRSAERQVVRSYDVALTVAVGNTRRSLALGCSSLPGPVVLGGERPCRRKAGSRNKRCAHQGAAGFIGTRGGVSDFNAFAATAKFAITLKNCNV
jgi:hypothetical protein